MRHTEGKPRYYCFLINMLKNGKRVKRTMLVCVKIKGWKGSGLFSVSTCTNWKLFRLKVPFFFFFFLVSRHNPGNECIDTDPVTHAGCLGTPCGNSIHKTFSILILDYVTCINGKSRFLALPDVKLLALCTLCFRICHFLLTSADVPTSLTYRACWCWVDDSNYIHCMGHRNHWKTMWLESG